MRLAHVEERIIKRGKIARENQRGDAGFVGLERQRDDVAHQPGVLAQIFGQAVVRPLHREQRLPLSFGAVFGLVLVDAHPFDVLLDVAHAGQIFIQLGLVGGADLAAQLLRRDLSRDRAR